MKIVIAEKVAANAVQVFREEKGWTVVTHDQLNGNLANALPDADALIVRSAVDVNVTVLSMAERLRVIGRAGVGTDNIDLDAATKAGIAVMNTPGANAVAVAEHTLALMLALSRHITRADATTKSGRWEKKSLQGSELRGKTLGIVGLGKIGMEVAARAKAFHMEVVAHDPFVPELLASNHAIKLVGLDELYASADYLTLHVALTPQTTGMINEDSLAKMKRGIRIINCARGELIDDVALATALKSKHVAGAALDVFTEEPPRDSPLLALDNVIVTPHIAGSTNEAQDAVGIQIASQVREYLKHGVVLNAVNMPSIGFEQYEEMRPYIALAGSLGVFIGRISFGDVEEISIHYGGRIADWKTEMIRNAAVQGILNQFAAKKVNVINAVAIAREKGIQLHESGNEKPLGRVVKDVITLTLRTRTTRHSVKGAVFNGSSLRLLAVDNIDIEVPLEGSLIFLRNRDVPGVVGKVGTVLGQHGVNIGSFAVGRNDLNERGAISVLQIDGCIEGKILRELLQVKEVESANSICFCSSPTS
jgi:D-3-phosphoglycerate dehydrogenase